MQREISDYQRGILKGLQLAEEVFSSELYKEMERENTPFPNEYKECASFIGIMMPKRFEEYTINLPEPKHFGCGCHQAYDSQLKLFIVPCCRHTTMNCVNPVCTTCINKNSIKDLTCNEK